MINVTVRLFATLRKNREKEIKMDLPNGSTIKEVIKILDISEGQATILMVNGKRVSITDTLKNNDIVAIFPPIGGG